MSETIQNPEALIETICENFKQRFQEKGFEEDSIETMVSFLARMSEVSIQLVSQEGDIEIPNTNHKIPFETGMQEKTVWMFAEGLAFSLEKIATLNIPDEAKGEILQNVAQYVYESSKQVILSTFGQEHTPELQIPMEQQVTMVTQTADNALNHFIAEYERINGPIEDDEDDDVDNSEYDMDLSDVDTSIAEMSPSPQDAPAPAPQPVQQAQPLQTPAKPQPIAPPAAATVSTPSLSHPREKYAALALLVNVIPSEKAVAILQRFGPDEQQVIHHYQNPINIAQAGLDLKAVQRELNTLKERLASKPSPSAQTTPANIAPKASPSASESQIKALGNQVPPDVLNTVVQLERPHIREYINTLFEEDNGKNLLDPLQRPPIKLPQAIQNILSKHLKELVS